ncbi:MAG TPA: dipeptide epimerase [Baekduia sp.]|uniref:dipeptide epimerase n=1 Tax=Baekduia sp. TaxID=2600305 RepID=UPI002D78A7A1|nr:dipeptide epimerase [Baekduia sp.]HET6505314.1 dipeptide epimerase [Baekduia sp.]
MPEPARESIRLAHTRTRLTLRDPLVISKGAEQHADVVHVAVRWGGAVGCGEAAPQDEDGQTPESVARYLDAAAPLLGDDPFALEAILARAGASDRAGRAALDAALHDLVGTLIGQPMWRLLGLTPGGPPTTYTISLAEPQAMADGARAALTRFAGLRALKLKLGAGRDLDVARVRAIRSAVGPGVALVVDANEAWTLPEALAVLPALADAGVALVEQPLPRDSPEAPALKARSPVPVYADEACHTLADVGALADRVHGINIKMSKCGGPREALRMIHTARALGLGVMLGCQVESGLGLAPAVALSGLADVVDLDANLMLERDPAPGLTLRDGVQTASARPGLGVALEAVPG